MDLDLIYDSLRDQLYDLVSELEDAYFLFGNESEQYKAIEAEIEDTEKEMDDVEEEIAQRNYEDDLDIMRASYGW